MSTMEGSAGDPHIYNAAKDDVPAELHDAENEVAVLACLLFDNKQADRAADVVTENDFAEPIFGAIFSAITREVTAGRPALISTIAPMFANDPRFEAIGGRRRLAEWTGSAVAVFPVGPFAQAVRQIAVRRRLWISTRQALANLADLSIPTTDAIAEHEEGLAASMSDGSETEFHSAADCVDEVIASLSRPNDGVTSGAVEGIDRLIGNIQPGWLGIVAARPGAGKTATLVSYLRGAAARGHASLYVSLEVNWQTLGSRVVADACHATGRPILYGAITGKRLDNAQVREIARLKETVGDLPFKIVNHGCDTISGLRRAVRRYKRAMAAAGTPLRLVIIDYLQLLGPDQQGLSETEAITRVSRQLKLMATSEEVAIIAAAQLNRDVEKRADKRPILPDLRSSGQIEADADFVIFLLSQEYYHLECKPRESDPAYPQWEEKLFLIQNELEFICAKFRHGSTGNFFGKFYRQFQAVR